jgi:hypothetical protein
MARLGQSGGKACEFGKENEQFLPALQIGRLHARHWSDDAPPGQIDHHACLADMLQPPGIDFDQRCRKARHSQPRSESEPIAPPPTSAIFIPASMSLPRQLN